MVGKQVRRVNARNVASDSFGQQLLFRVCRQTSIEIFFRAIQCCKKQLYTSEIVCTPFLSTQNRHYADKAIVLRRLLFESPHVDLVNSIEAYALGGRLGPTPAIRS